MQEHHLGSILTFLYLAFMAKSSWQQTFEIGNPLNVSYQQNKFGIMVSMTKIKNWKKIQACHC